MDGSVRQETKYPLSSREVGLASIVILGFVLGLFGVYMTMPASDYDFLKMPSSLEERQILRDNLEGYTSDYTLQVLVGYCMVYMFMQTFMIPGTVFMSLLTGSLFGVFKGVALVIFAATAGASSCFFLSKLIGRPIVFFLWPDRLSSFQAQVAKRRERLLNYMLFLRVTPTLPNKFINFAAPIVNVPYHIFFLATVIGLIPVRAGIALGDLQSVKDLYDFQSIATLFFIGVVSIMPTLISKKDSQLTNSCLFYWTNPMRQNAFLYIFNHSLSAQLQLLHSVGRDFIIIIHGGAKTAAVQEDSHLLSAWGMVDALVL